MVREVEFLVIGGGPAGLAAALVATREGVNTILLDDAATLGGQLVKQTHKFFGSEMEYAGVRGIWIPEKFLGELMDNPLFESYTETSATGYYEDGVVTALRKNDEWLKFKPKAMLVATGAQERMIPFPGNDLPGVYGAGAVQTLMNVHGVVPAKNVLMVGAGNIGLIVSYQLLQAGVPVEAIVEAMPHIGGYWVHASKVRRLGVPILTRHTIVRAYGERKVEGATIAQLDDRWQVISGTERDVDVDTVCLAVGLSSLVDILFQAGVEMRYVASSGGEIPLRDKTMQTSKAGIFVAGDAAGIEEASSAMIEGRIAGLGAARFVKGDVQDFDNRLDALWGELDSLRAGPIGEKVRESMKMVMME